MTEREKESGRVEEVGDKGLRRCTLEFRNPNELVKRGMRRKESGGLILWIHVVYTLSAPYLHL